jgi:hypothetical protein
VAPVAVDLQALRLSTNEWNPGWRFFLPAQARLFNDLLS